MRPEYVERVLQEVAAVRARKSYYVKMAQAAGGRSVY